MNASIDLSHSLALDGNVECRPLSLVECDDIGGGLQITGMVAGGQLVVIIAGAQFAFSGGYALGSWLNSTYGVSTSIVDWIKS